MDSSDILDMVAGVDFSGAKTVPNETWIALGKLSSMGVEIIDVKHVGSHKVAQSLADTPGLAAAGFDFPFSLPTEFLYYMAEKRSLAPFQSWQEVAECLAFLSFDDFQELVASFNKEPKRFADKETKPVAQSPLHRGNPSMVQMTYQGMRMLTTLNPERFAIQPFQRAKKGMCEVLEVFPSATLNAAGLPCKGYKSQEKKDKDAMMALRKTMLRQLVSIRETGTAALKDCPRLTMNAKVDSQAITSDDAFDAVVACYTAAMYVVAPKYFVDPLAADNLDVLTEGWIFHPSFAEKATPKRTSSVS